MEKKRARTGRYLILKPLFVASQITWPANVSKLHSGLFERILNRKERKRSHVAMSFITALWLLWVVTLGTSNRKHVQSKKKNNKKNPKHPGFHCTLMVSQSCIRWFWPCVSIMSVLRQTASTLRQKTPCVQANQPTIWGCIQTKSGGFPIVSKGAICRFCRKKSCNEFHFWLLPCHTCHTVSKLHLLQAI